MCSQSKTARLKKTALQITARHHSERKIASDLFPDVPMKQAYKMWKRERATKQATK